LEFYSTCYRYFFHESSGQIEIDKAFLVFNSNDNGVVEMSAVRLILPPLLSVVAQAVQCTAKT